MSFSKDTLISLDYLVMFTSCASQFLYSLPRVHPMTATNEKIVWAFESSFGKDGIGNRAIHVTKKNQKESNGYQR